MTLQLRAANSCAPAGSSARRPLRASAPVSCSSGQRRAQDWCGGAARRSSCRQSQPRPHLDAGRRAWGRAADRAGRQLLPSTAAIAEPDSAEVSDTVVTPTPGRWRRFVVFIAVALFMCNVDRAALAVAGLPIQEEFGLSSMAMGVLQSSYLWGYCAGQLPAGILSDRLGGTKVMMVGLFIWSIATVLFAFAHLTPNPVLALGASRCIFGLASAAALPAVTATVSASVPKKRRGRMLSYIYGAFNVGSIVGVGVTPIVISVCGWKSAFIIFGMTGCMIAVFAALVLPPVNATSADRAPPPPPEQLQQLQQQRKEEKREPLLTRAREALSRIRVQQVLYLAYLHCVIGFGFFIMLSWIPTYLSTTIPGGGGLDLVGLMSALPWAVSTGFGLAAGTISDTLAERFGWKSFKIRTAMHAMATLVPGVSLLLLPLVNSPYMAVGLLCFALGGQAFNYAGFHAHIQDVASPYAGTILSFTNTCGILMGIAGNVLTGVVLDRTNSFGAIFCICGLFYISSFLVWMKFVRPVQLVRRGWVA